MICKRIADHERFHKVRCNFKSRSATYGNAFHIVRKMEKLLCLHGLDKDAFCQSKAFHSLRRTTIMLVTKIETGFMLLFWDVVLLQHARDNFRTTAIRAPKPLSSPRRRGPRPRALSMKQIELMKQRPGLGSRLRGNDSQIAIAKVIAPHKRAR
jgi:hypothetical protein